MSEMDGWITQQNIQRFSELLRFETNDERRKTLTALLDAEQNRHRCFTEREDGQLIVPPARPTSLKSPSAPTRLSRQKEQGDAYTRDRQALTSSVRIPVESMADQVGNHVLVLR